MGYNLEDIARNIDEDCVRQPLGVCAGIVPFNFPAMVSHWFMPYAIACGNTYVLKPSEQVPLSMSYCIGLMDKAGFPKGVINLVNGAKEAVDAILDNPDVRAISFVGSTAIAKYVYQRGHGQWEAGAVPGRSQELHGSHARRRRGQDDRQHDRVVVRRRWTAVSRGGRWYSR